MDAGQVGEAEGAPPPAGAVPVAPPVPPACSCCRISLPTSSSTSSITSCDRVAADSSQQLKSSKHHQLTHTQAGRCWSNGMCSLVLTRAHDARNGSVSNTYCLRWGAAVPYPHLRFSTAEQHVVPRSPTVTLPPVQYRGAPPLPPILPRIPPTFSFCSSCGSASHTPAMTHSAWAGQLSATLVSVPFRVEWEEGPGVEEWEEPGAASQGPSGDSRHSSGQPGAASCKRAGRRKGPKVTRAWATTSGSFIAGQHCRMPTIRPLPAPHNAHWYRAGPTCSAAKSPAMSESTTSSSRRRRAATSSSLGSSRPSWGACVQMPVSCVCGDAVVCYKRTTCPQQLAERQQLWGLVHGGMGLLVLFARVHTISSGRSS